MQLRYFLLGESLTQGCLSCWKVDPSTDPSRCNLPLCRCSSSEEPSYVLPTPWLQYESPVFPEALLGCSSCFGLSSVACNRSRSLEASCRNHWVTFLLFICTWHVVASMERPRHFSLLIFTEVGWISLSFLACLLTGIHLIMISFGSSSVLKEKSFHPSVSQRV